MPAGLNSVRIKILLLVVALVIAVGTLYYTQNLVTKLQERERQIVQLHAKGIEYVANTFSQDADITFLFDNIIKPIDFPMILTDADDQVNFGSKEDIRNVQYDSALSKQELKNIFNAKVKEMDKIHLPILVTYADTVILTKIHYGDSELI